MPTAGGRGFAQGVLPGDYGAFTGIGGMNSAAFASRLAYRAATGQQAVYDDDRNGLPDAWQNPNGSPPAWFSQLIDSGGPPGLTMGVGGGGGGGTMVDNSVVLAVYPGALSMEVRVAATADLDRVGDLVRNVTNDALQRFITQLQTQLRSRTRIRV